MATGEPAVDEIVASSFEEAMLDEATSDALEIVERLDDAGVRRELIGAWLLSQAYFFMASEYLPGAVYDWGEEGLRELVKNHGANISAMN